MIGSPLDGEEIYDDLDTGNDSGEFEDDLGDEMSATADPGALDLFNIDVVKELPFGDLDSWGSDYYDTTPIKKTKKKRTAVRGRFPLPTTTAALSEAEREAIRQRTRAVLTGRGCSGPCMFKSSASYRRQQLGGRD